MRKYPCIGAPHIRACGCIDRLQCLVNRTIDVGEYQRGGISLKNMQPGGAEGCLPGVLRRGCKIARLTESQRPCHLVMIAKTALPFRAKPGSIAETVCSCGKT